MEAAVKITVSLMLLLLSSTPVYPCNQKSIKPCHLHCTFYVSPSHPGSHLSWIKPDSLLWMPHMQAQYVNFENVGHVTDLSCTTERRKHSTAFKCNLKYTQSCFVGFYLYDFNYGVLRKEQHYGVGYYPEAEGIHTPTVSTCYWPRVANIIVKFLNGSAHVNWSYSDRPQDQKYCNGSRQFEIRYQAYRNHYLGEYSNSSWFSVGPRRTTEFTFENINTELYYKFEIKNNRNNTKSTILKYFKPQESPHTLTIDVVKTSNTHIARTVSGDYKLVIQSGTSVSITCSAEGIPSPTVAMYRANSNDGNNPLIFHHGAHPDDTGSYYCVAKNTFFDKVSGKALLGEQRVHLEVIVYDQNDPQCVYYESRHCNPYISDEWKVFADSETIQSVQPYLKQLDNLNLSSQCLEFAKSIMCHVNTPYCDPDSLVPSPMLICPKTCAQLEAQCGQALNANQEVYNKIFSWCANGRPSDLILGCIYINSKRPALRGDRLRIPAGDETYSCYTGNGQTYRGSVFHTESGLWCRNWESNTSHSLPIPDLVMEDLMGSLMCRNPGGILDRPWCFTNTIEEKASNWEYCDITHCLNCVPYDGDYCKSLGYSNSSMVLINTHTQGSSPVDWEYEFGGKLYHKGFISSLSPGCMLALKQLLCYGTMPTCSSNLTNTLCVGHCSLIRDLHTCSPGLLEWLGLLEQLDAKCANATSDANEECMPAVVRLTLKEEEEEDGKMASGSDACYHGDDLGQSYSGAVNITQSGLHCLDWTSLGATGIDTTMYPELQGAVNHCRNPGQLAQKPWCYISAKAMWELCDVFLCNDGSGASVPESSTAVESSSPGSDIIISITVVISIALLLVFVGFTIIVLVGHRKRYSIPTKGDMIHVSHDNRLQEIHAFLSSVTLNNIKKFRTIHKDRVRYIKELGHGNFGVVFLGKCKGLEDGEDETAVAIKLLKEDSSREAVSDFMKEVKILHEIDHPHIVHFYGVCMNDPPFFMIFEYMDLGDLCEYLRLRSSSAQRMYNPPKYRSRIYSNVSNESATLGVTQLLDICKQICSGMEYLESKNHIHRDLACRNCLVRTGQIVKIADFGMSRNLYSRDYYRLKGEASLPIRWMAPESLIYGTFSSAGDVWAFGVVVWEVFSFALQPYMGIPNDVVTDMVRRGKLLSKPESCPDKIFHLVGNQCWRMNPLERPSFKELDFQFQNIRLSDSDTSEISVLIDGDDTVFNDDNYDAC